MAKNESGNVNLHILDENAHLLNGPHPQSNTEVPAQTTTMKKLSCPTYIEEGAKRTVAAAISAGASHLIGLSNPLTVGLGGFCFFCGPNLVSGCIESCDTPPTLST